MIMGIFVGVKHSGRKSFGYTSERERESDEDSSETINYLIAWLPKCHHGLYGTIHYRKANNKTQKGVNTKQKGCI